MPKKVIPNTQNRESLSAKDLFQAKQFINHILTNSLHEKIDQENKLALEAFNIAVIISYSRPFKQSRSSVENPADATLSDEHLNTLTESEGKLHKRVIAMRDEEIAHSDADAHSLRFGIMRNTAIPLEKPEFIQLGEIIDKLLSRVIKPMEF